MIANSIPTVPAPPVSAPNRRLPEGACDAHSHVFGPFVRMQPAPDAGRLADLVQHWIGDTGLIRRILVTYPNELYGFNKEKQP